MSTPAAKVLLVHSDMPITRLVRQSLEAFCDCQVETTSSSLIAFERALQKDYKLYLFDLKLETIDGVLLYELIGKALQYSQQGRTVPAVMFFCETQEASRRDDLLRDARVKGLITTPINISRLLEKMEGILPVRGDLPI